MKILVTAGVVVCLIATPASIERQNEPVTSLLDRYYAGKFDEVVSALARLPKLDSIIDGLTRDGARWISQGPADQLDRRELAAATFALEAARVGEWAAWKIRIVQPLMAVTQGADRPAAYLQWAPAPRLIEWGCARFRQHAETTPAERWWQLGAMAVAERAEDEEFLIGNDRPIVNEEADVVHLKHTLDRFPDEPRFLMVKAIALEWRTWPEMPRGQPRGPLNAAMAEFEQLLEHEAIGAEASVRLASLLARTGQTERAYSLLTAVEDQTRDKYLIYLARFFRGRLHESLNQRREALSAYRGAAATLPGAQAASLALASLLASADRRDEAAELVDRTLNAPIPDPWRGYADADDRFWPEIIARLRRQDPSRRMKMRAATSRSFIFTSALSFCSALALAQSSGQTPVQTPFRAITDLVSVPVAVRAGGRPVTGLTAADFTVTDTGVEQRIERVDAESLPIDVTLALDTSGSTAFVIERLKRDAVRIASFLRPQDRVRLLTIDTYATQVFPFQPASESLSFEKMTVLGLSSVHDTIAAALLDRVPADRRHLIVVMTDSIDSISALGVSAVETAAQVSDAVLEVFLLDTVVIQDYQNFACLMAGLCERESRFWIPYQDREFLRIKRAAETTGGEMRSPGVFMDRTAVGMFRDVFEDYRHSYVIRYSARGVLREGWHPIEVRLKSPASRVVRARRGYLIGTKVADADRPVPRPWHDSVTLPALVRDYTRDEFQPVTEGLNTSRRLTELMRDLRTGGNPWPNQPRREAVFLLELADAALYSHDLEAVDAAASHLSWYEKLLRHPLEPDAFERIWRWGEVALLEGILSPARAMPAVENALRRFPTEPRFLLARAVTLDQVWGHKFIDPLAGGLGHALIEEGRLVGTAGSEQTIEAYEKAAEYLETRFEARVRLGFLYYRLGRYADAAKALDVGPPPDKELAYLQWLIQGKVFDALGQFDLAGRHLNDALSAFPDAQSARVAIMTLAIRRGDRQAATAMAEAIETQPPASFDPFWRYWQGDVRYFSTIRGILRRSIQ